MDEHTSQDGQRRWIYVKNWERFQLRSDQKAGFPWLKLYTDLADNPDWVDLSTPNRCLLVCLWMDVGRLGNGRVNAELRTLRRRHNLAKCSLEPLVQAGFIEVRRTKGARDEHDDRAPEENRIEEKKTARARARVRRARPLSKEERQKTPKDKRVGPDWPFNPVNNPGGYVVKEMP